MSFDNIARKMAKAGNDVREFNSINDFPTVGVSGAIYIDASDNSMYRWNRNEYTLIGGELAPATSNTLGGVKIGTGINVTEDGTISASGGKLELEFTPEYDDETGETTWTCDKTFSEIKEAIEDGFEPHWYYSNFALDYSLLTHNEYMIVLVAESVESAGNTRDGAMQVSVSLITITDSEISMTNDGFGGAKLITRQNVVDEIDEITGNPNSIPTTAAVMGFVESIVPEFNEVDDEGKVLKIVDGSPTWVTI